MNPSFNDLCDLISTEALYATVREIAASQQKLLSRQEFVREAYIVVVNVDGLRALVRANQSLIFAVKLGSTGPQNGTGRKWVGPR